MRIFGRLFQSLENHLTQTNMSKQTEDSSSHINSQESKSILPFPVVGIGASAGGLEALQDFFKNTPKEPNVAFVIVQHLSPDYKSFMDELLGRTTQIPILVVKDKTKVESNHIYLIPPKMNMTIEDGVLRLQEISDKRFLNLPIDIFFRSLALDQQKNAIGIILSGTGSDGALGVRAIKEYGGMTMVQDNRSAKFDGMPRSSISTGMIDYIKSSPELAKELINFVKHPFVSQNSNIEYILDTKKDHLETILSILHAEKGVDFSNYKKNTIIRRLEKRISINRFEKIEEYVRFLKDNPKETNTLFNELLIGVTRFFRDETSFAILQKIVIPQLFKELEDKKEIRIWVTACSTGEEAYSIAILFKEYMQEVKIHKDIKIFATDLDKNSIDFAGTGLYPDNIASDVKAEYLSQYFTRKDIGYQINESIRSMIIFAQHNILSDPPFSKLNFISCRNLLIYLENDIQSSILASFNQSLILGGYLFLGTSESLGTLSDGFNVIDQKAKLFKKAKTLVGSHISVFGSPSQSKTRSELMVTNRRYRSERYKHPMLEKVFDHILHDYLTPSVIVDENFTVLHSIHDVSNYLTLPVGQMSLNLLKMLPKEVSILVSSLIRRAEKADKTISIDKIQHSQFPKELSISCKKISDIDSENTYFLLSFSEQKENTAKPKHIERININEQYQDRIGELERELQLKSESLQATVEELETSNEELQSSNEELIASNEELQSTNEELQSVNEELYTVNNEHLRKIDELTELNTDFDNLLKNTYIGNLYLDNNLLIRKINTVASRLTNILPVDMGRPISHLSLNMLYNGFIKDVNEVNKTLRPIEKEIIEERTGKWYLMRILPYLTSENKTDGIIILFIDISSLKTSQNTVHQLSDRLNYALHSGEMSWWEWDVKNNVVITGSGKYTMLGYTEEEIGDGFDWWTSLIHPDDYEASMDAMRSHLEGKAELYYIEYRIKHKNGNYLWYRDKGKIIRRSDDGKPELLTGVVMNITKEIESQKTIANLVTDANNQTQKMSSMYNLLFDTMNQGVVFQNEEGQIIDANPQAQKLLGVSLQEMTKRSSKSPQWKPLRKDKTEFPGKEHPAMLALKTKKVQKNVTMGVYNPKLEKYVWIDITAIPFQASKTSYMVYTIFEEVNEPD